MEIEGSRFGRAGHSERGSALDYITLSGGELDGVRDEAVLIKQREAMGREKGHGENYLERPNPMRK